MAKSKIASAVDQYKSVGVRSGVEGASAHRLVQMLMEGALDKIAIAKGQIERKEFEGKGHYISWAIAIINGLRDSLDKQAGGEIANNLDEVYRYMVRRLLEANRRNDAAMLTEVSSLLFEIKSAWDAMPDHLKHAVPQPTAKAAGG
jgi:flagellar protein FliS